MSDQKEAADPNNGRCAKRLTPDGGHEDATPPPSQQHFTDLLAIFRHDREQLDAEALRTAKEKRLDEEWAAAIPKSVIYAGVYSKSLKHFGIVNWGRWRQTYERVVAMFKSQGEDGLVQEPFYALFATLAYHICTQLSRCSLGSVEIQLWIHTAILKDIVSIECEAKHQMAALKRLSCSTFSKTVGKSFATICDTAVRLIKDRNDPYIGGKELLWQRNEPFALVVPFYLQETAEPISIDKST